MASAEKQKGNRNNILRSLSDFLGGISRYDSTEHPGSAPEMMRRKQADKAKGPTDPSKLKLQ